MLDGNLQRWCTRIGYIMNIQLPREIKGSDAVLVTLLLDDSDSISACRNVSVVTRGANAFREQLIRRGGSAMQAFLRVATLNQRDVGRDFVVLSNTEPLENDDWFRPGFNTPLFAAARRALYVSAESARRARVWYSGDVLSITVIVTDGADNASGDITAQRVCRRVQNMLATGHHMVVGCGVYDGATDFHAVFRSMGIPDRMVMVMERTDEDIEEGLTNLGRFAAASTENIGTFTQNLAAGVGSTPSVP